MPKYIKYRGAKRVPIVKATVKSGQQGKKNPIMNVWPRKDWRNPGEKIPVTRTKNHIYSTSARIPLRKRSKS